MYAVGIVGCGVIGNRFGDAIAKHERLRVDACCDLDEQRADAFGEDYGCRPYTDHERMLSEEALDVVYVGVPPVAHQAVTEAALAADVHVICEKPIAPDAATGGELVAAANDTDRTTAINLPFRYTTGFRELVDRVDAGEIGDVGRIELRFRFPQWPREWQDVDWLETREQGGPLREVGTHFLFGVQELFGPIDRLAATVQYTGPDRYERSITGWFEVDGIDGTIDLLCDHAGEEENVITVTGKQSSLSLTEWYRLVENRHRSDERVVDERRTDTVTSLLDEFVAELDGDGGDLVGFEEANAVQRVVDAIFGSEGYPVTIEAGREE